MTFGKILAGLVAILIIWVMVPHVKRGEYISPNPLPPGFWGLKYDYAGTSAAYAEPAAGYGFRRYDIWNNPPSGGRPVTTDDFQLRY